MITRSNQELLLMPNYKNVVITLLIGLVSIGSLINLSNAATMSITVPAGEEVNQKIELEVDDRVVIQFTVIGTENSFIFFSLICSNATEIKYGEVGVFNYSFMSDAEGEYILNFVNKDTSESKLVTLNYDIEHYMFGMPQLFFLALIIAVICLAMLATYVLMGQSL